MADGKKIIIKIYCKPFKWNTWRERKLHFFFVCFNNKNNIKLNFYLMHIHKKKNIFFMLLHGYEYQIS